MSAPLLMSIQKLLQLQLQHHHHHRLIVAYARQWNHHGIISSSLSLCNPKNNYQYLCYSTTTATNSSNDRGGGGGRSNFDRDVLLPASRGEIPYSNNNKSTNSMIPKLMARKTKANLGVLGSSGGNGRSFLDDDDDNNDDDDRYDFDSYYMDPNEDILDPNDPYSTTGKRKNKAMTTLTKISNQYHHRSSTARGLLPDNIDDGKQEDTDPQKYVLLNADVMMNRMDSDNIAQREQELDIMTHVLMDTVRHVAELAIIEASETSGAVLTQQQKDDNETRKQTIMNQLHNIEQRVINDDIVPSSSSSTTTTTTKKKYMTNGVKNSSLNYVSTNLLHGIKYDGTPSVDTTNLKFHTNKYLPYNKYYLSQNNSNDEKEQLLKDMNSYNLLYDGDDDDNYADEDSNSIMNLNNSQNQTANNIENNPEMEMIQQEAILAYAKELELDLDFYWNEMDYDYLNNNNDNNATTTLIGDVPIDVLKDELAKKEAIEKVLQEEELEARADALEGISVGVDDLDMDKDGKGGGGSEKKDDAAALANLTPRQKQEQDFVKWFCKKNDILQYMNDPELMSAKQIQNLSPMARKRLEDMGVDFNVRDNQEADERDVLYKDHPDMMELCSGSSETILVEAPHADSKRQPKPYFRPHIQYKISNKDDVFFQKYRRFAYVNNLPPIYIESISDKSLPSKLIDITNPVDRTYFQRTVAKVMDIDDIDQIYPASNTSAFIGYSNAMGLAKTLLNGPNYDIVKSAIEDKIPTPTLQLLSSIADSTSTEAEGATTSATTAVSYKDHPFVTKCNTAQPDSDKCIVVLSNLDGSNGRRYTPLTLVQDLFKSSANKSTSSSSSAIDIGDMVYGNITPDDVCMVNPTTALIKLASPEQASSVLDSNTIRTQLRLLNTRIPQNMNGGTSSHYNNRIEVFRARRELIHRGWNTKRGQIRGTDEIRTLGNRLIVNGDMPTKPFYISHGGVVMLSNVDPTIITKKDISDFVQPYCSLRRDIEGSIEWVTCDYHEQRTDRVYVGFDLVHEAEAFVKAVGTTTSAFYKNIDPQRRPIHLKVLKDRQPPNYPAPPLQRRPDRTIEELLIDLNHWEQFVDPADIAFLEQHHISKHVLDETFRSARYNNNTFGALDYAMRSESIEPEKSTGQQYRDFVQVYVKTLKDCIATPENPGVLFELQSFPNEEPDLGYIEHEHRRLERIQKQRDPRFMNATSTASATLTGSTTSTTNIDTA